MPTLARCLFVPFTILLLAACSSVEPREPRSPLPLPVADSAPIPRLDTGGHTAPIKRIAVDRAGRWLVSASDDKTARVWDLRSGELLQVLRPPLGRDAREGKLYAVALSPDGATVALGGWTKAGTTGNHVYLFDRASGTLHRALGGLPDVVDHLAWSPDGRRLAATLGSGAGLRVYAPADGREVYADADYGAASYGADFAADGRLLTTSYDGRLRRYRPSGEGYVREAPVSAPGGRRPFFARFTPDGRRLAVGYDDSTRVDVLDATTLAPLPGLAATAGIDNGDLSKVAWSRDGRTLYAAGRYVDADGRSLLIRWAGGGRGPRTAVALATDIVMDLVALADGGLAFGAQDPLWGVLGADGRVRRYGGGQIADFRDHEGDLRVDATATRVDFGYATAAADLARQAHTACFDLPARRLAAGRCAGRLRAADTAGQPRADWWDTTTPRVDGRALSLRPDETSFSLAVTDRGFVLGTHWAVYAFARDGTRRWRQPLPGAAWAVNVSGDGRHVVAALGDGTLRWYADRGERAEEVLALYLHPDGERWIAWTPQGFFDASGADAEALFGYHLNRGPAQAGEFVRASQLRERFLNPELIAHRLDADGDERLAQAVRQRGGDINTALLGAERLQLTPRSPATLRSADGEVTLEFGLDRPLQAGEKLVVRVDGKEVEARGADASAGKQYVALKLSLAPGTRRVEVAARNTQQVDSAWTETRVEVAPRTLQRGLHVIAIGVSRYYDSDFDLKYAASDAKAIADALEAHAHPAVFPRGMVTRKVLPDAEATRDNILHAFAELAASPQLQPEDTVVVYLAGHGLSREGDYRFLPYELRITDSDAVTRQALDGDTLRGLLRKLPADTLIVLDTCNAGSALRGGVADARGDDPVTVKEQLARTIELSGRAFLVASGPKQLALEGHEGHGFFTYALLEGLERRELYAGGSLNVDRLWNYAYDRVGELTAARGYRQVPMRDVQNRTFPIAGPRP